MFFFSLSFFYYLQTLGTRCIDYDQTANPIEQLVRRWFFCARRRHGERMEIDGEVATRLLKHSTDSVAFNYCGETLTLLQRLHCIRRRPCEEFNYRRKQPIDRSVLSERERERALRVCNVDLMKNRQMHICYRPFVSCYSSLLLMVELSIIAPRYLPERPPTCSNDRTIGSVACGMCRSQERLSLIEGAKKKKKKMHR